MGFEPRIYQCGDSPDELANFSLPVEHIRRSVTSVPTMRNPFDVLAEGLISENSRGDWIGTPRGRVPAALSCFGRIDRRTIRVLDASVSSDRRAQRDSRFGRQGSVRPGQS